MTVWAVALLVLGWALLPSRGLMTSPDVEELQAHSSWVISNSSTCSATCGLGLRTQTLCPLVEGTASASAECHVRRVRCMDTWRCGLETLTVATGGRLRLNCLGEVTEAMGRFAFMVSWRFARGVVTTDNTLFVRWEGSGLATVTLSPLSEEHAGTYRCDVLDTAFRRVKRIYMGVKVLPRAALTLDFDDALSQWDRPDSLWPNITLVSGQPYPSKTLRDMVVLSFSVSVAIAMLIFLGFLGYFHWRWIVRAALCRPGSE